LSRTCQPARPSRLPQSSKSIRSHSCATTSSCRVSPSKLHLRTPPRRDETPVSLEDRELHLPRVSPPGPRVRLRGFAAQSLMPLRGEAGGIKPGGQAGFHAPFEWSTTEGVRPRWRRGTELCRDHI